MQAIIDNAIEQINKGAEWVLNNARVEPKKSYKALVKQRRTLKKIRNVLEDKPAVVLYGQSQCGKSHLANILLSPDGQDLLVNDRLNNIKYNFKDRFNPPGGGESTGIITRFTISKQEGITKEYPLHIKLMSIKDIVLMLCDGYYFDLGYHEPFKIKEINELITKLKQKKTAKQQNYITEDDIRDIEDYHVSFFENAIYNPLSSDATDYLGELSLLIEHLDERDILTALNMLWNNDEKLSQKFYELFEICKKLDFSEEAYISYSEIDRTKGNTLLNIAWLDNTDTQTESILYFKNYDGKYSTISIPKTYLATICSEIIIEVEDSSKGINATDILMREKNEYVSHILKNIDILDFPGARARRKLDGTAGNVGEILRRGKVGYYFNKYSSERKLLSLLFCWEYGNFDVPSMNRTLRYWIDTTIGKDEDKRSEYMRTMNVPPLFLIGTKYNDVLFQKTGEPKGIDLNERWKKWFIEQLSQNIIGVPGNMEEAPSGHYTWFVSWTNTAKSFDNIYLLRDFRYSHNIFNDWKTTGKENNQKNYPYPDYYEKLKESFLNHPFVKQHFKDAESRWDEASEANCDGSLPIARNLASIAEKLASAAMGKNLRDVRAALEDVITELRKHHYDPKAEENLKKALDSAARLQSALDIAFGKDRYFYGTFMKTLTISEQKVHNVFSDAFTTIGKADTLGAYVFIYMRAPDISPYNKFDDNLRILCSAYQFANTDDCRHHFEKTLHIDLNDLFKKKDIGMKSPSQMLSSALKKFLFNEWIGKEQKDKLIETLGEGCFLELKDMLISLYDKYDVEQTIASRIHNYVDKFGNNIQVISEMIADMCAEMINKFLLSVGYDYYNEKDGVMDNFKEEVASKPGIHIDFQFLDTKPRAITKEDMATLLSEMDERESIQQMLWQPDQHTTELSNLIPGFRQGCRWRDLAKIGYVLTNDIPHYDVEANEQLGQIIKQCESIKGNVEVKLNN